jgi:hypothetical protein
MRTTLFNSPRLGFTLSYRSLPFSILHVRVNALTEVKQAWTMRPNINVNPTSAHQLYLKLFITNGGGW